MITVFCIIVVRKVIINNTIVYFLFDIKETLETRIGGNDDKIESLKVSIRVMQIRIQNCPISSQHLAQKKLWKNYFSEISEKCLFSLRCFLNEIIFPSREMFFSKWSICTPSGHLLPELENPFIEIHWF